MTAVNVYARQVQRMYVAYYGRPGDPAGVEYWAGRLAEAGGNWIDDLVNAFGTSQEYTDRFEGLSDEALIENLYRQLFNRSPEPLGLAFYLDLLRGTNASGLNPSLRQSTLAQIALDIANGAQNEDLTTLENKLEVAGDFTQRIAETGRRYVAADIPQAVDLLALVTDAGDSVAAGMDAVDDFVDSAPVEPKPPLINKLVSEVDASSPSQGLPVQFVRTYLLDSTFEGPLGYGWTHSYRMRILATDTAVQLFEADGTGSDFLSNLDGTYRSPRGDFRTLTKSPNGVYSLIGKSGTRHFFSGNGKPFRIEDRDGNAITLQYDGFDMLDSVTDDAGQVTFLAYDENNRIWAVTDPAGRSVTYGYDGSGNLVSVTDIGGATTTYAYDAQHNLTTVTDPLGNRTHFTADGEDRLLSVSGEGDANRLTFQYRTPAADRMTITDALGNATVITYDTNASVTQVVDALGNVSSFAYDTNLNLTRVTDDNGNRSLFGYDARGNLVSSTDAAGNVTSLTYELVSNQVTSLTDARGNTTTFEYDANGNLTRTTYPDGSAEGFAYDGLGNLAAKTDRKGQTIDYFYDAQSRLIEKSFPDGTSDLFTYDAAGNLTSATDENGTISFAYDSADRIVQVVYPGGETVSYEYDAAGNRSRLVYPSGLALDYEYDALNRLTAIRSGADTVATYAYDLLRRTTRRELQNGTFSTYSYDDAGQLLELINKKSTGEVISSFAYTYDALGNRSSMTTLQGTTGYVYDAISQLVNVTKPVGVVTGYELDEAGNRIFMTENGISTAYVTNDLNQYTNVGGDAYRYDANGNLIEKITPVGITSYLYDFENRLVQVDTPTDLIEYKYDPLGRRNEKKVNADITRFMHDGVHALEERNGSGGLQASYVFGTHIDEILVMRRGGWDYYYSHDGLLSVVDITDEDGTVLETFSYDVYGKPDNISFIGNPYLFTGRFYEDETKQYYYRARFYNPSLGRFIGEDPIGLTSGVNLHTYSRNNPATFVDSLGLNPFDNLTEKIVSAGGILIGVGSYILPNLEFLFGEAFIGGTVVSGFAILGGVTVGILVGEIGFLLFPPQPLFPDSAPGDPFFGCVDIMGVIACADIPPNNGTNNLPAGNPGGGITDPLEILCAVDPSFCTCQESVPNMCAADPTFVQGGFTDDWMTRLVSKRTNESLSAKIHVPSNNSLVRAHVPVFGLAYGNKFNQYHVEYGIGSDPTEWTSISTSTAPQLRNITGKDLNDSLSLTIKGNLATWDTGLTNYVYLPSHPKDHPINLNGTYTLRLVVTGTDGSEVEDRVTVHVANVIPNPWGGLVLSKDGRVTLTVLEQAIMDSFRLISIQPAEAETAAILTESQVVGTLYQIREPGERFSKETELRIAFDPGTADAIDPARLGIHGYDPDKAKWEPVASYRYEGEDAVYAKVRRLHAYYALMAGNDPTQGSLLAKAGADQEGGALRPVREAAGPYLVRDTFEESAGEWSNRDHEVGGEVALDDSATYDGTRALRIINTNAGGNFAVNAVTTPFDVREYPIVQFDYRIPAGVKTNLLAKVAGRWYEVGFTDDPNPLEANRVNIAHIGDIADVAADDQWHTARFNLYDMLRTRTGNTQVDEIVMVDWDVKGYMLLQFGHNAKGATYYIDNFSIRRDPTTGLRLADDRVLIDNFNQRKETNRFGSHAEVFADSTHNELEVVFSQDAEDGRGHALALVYDMQGADSYCGYLTHLPEIDLRGFQGLSLRLKGAADEREALIGLRDRAGHESKVPLLQFVRDGVAGDWQSVTVPLAAFGSGLEWGAINAVTLSFEQQRRANGTLLIDDLAFDRELGSFLVDDFEQASAENLLGQRHRTFVNGAAAVNGQHTRGSPNGIYRISYGGNIGAINAYASELKSFAGWKTQLGGIDCTRCDTLALRVRGAVGGEDFTVYLDDGNFRWGVPVSQYVEVTSEWREVSIPVRMFAEYGVDLTHLESMDVVFEGQSMSGTVYLDDIQLSGSSH